MVTKTPRPALLLCLALGSLVICWMGVNALLAFRRDAIAAEENRKQCAYIAAACFEGDLPRAKEMLSKHGDRPCRGEYSSLHAAIAGGHAEPLKLVLDLGADPNDMGEFAQPPLVAAARNSNVELVRLLLAGGTDPGRQDPVGNSALVVAAEYGHVEAVKVMLRHRFPGMEGQIERAIATATDRWNRSGPVERPNLERAMAILRAARLQKGR
jgi:ankyrin repeat protein